MPEGHKTHFIAAQHNNYFAGEALKVTSPQGRFRAGARQVSGSVLLGVEAVGKHLFLSIRRGLNDPHPPGTVRKVSRL